MKQAIIVLAFAAVAVAAAIILSSTGVLDRVFAAQSSQDGSPERVKELYREEVDAYRQRREAEQRAEEADPRDPFARQALREGGDSAEWIAERLAEGEAICTQADLDGWTDEILPIIERITGWKFESRPVVTLADRAAIIDSVARDTNRILYGGEDNTFESLKNQAALQSAFLLGHFGMHSNEVFVVATNFQPLMKDQGFTDHEYQDLARLVLAHELAHALQSQWTGLLDQLSSDDVWEVTAVHAAYEGHAVLIEELVAAELGLEALSEALHHSISDRSTCFGFGSVREFAEGVVAEEGFSFGVARDFVRHHLEEGGHEKLRAILMSPPRKTSSIRNPGEWDREPRQLPTVLISTAVTDLITAAGFAQVHDQEAIGAIYQETIQRLDAGGQVLVARVKDWALVGFFKPPDGRGFVAIMAHRFRDPADTPVWFTSAAGYVPRMLEFSAGREDIAIEDVHDEAIAGLEEIAARRIRHVQFMRGQGRARFDESISVIDRMGVQLIVHAVEVDEEFHRRIHEEMWKFYRETVLGEGNSQPDA